MLFNVYEVTSKRKGGVRVSQRLSTEIIHVSILAMYGHAPEYICNLTQIKVPVTLIFFCFGQKVKSYMDTNLKKKQLNFWRLSMGFDSKKLKIWVLTKQIKDWNLWRSTSNLGTAYTQLLFV